MSTAESNKKHFEDIAGNTLDALAEVSAKADKELSAPPPLSAGDLSRNTFNDLNVARVAATHNVDRLRILQTIVDEPAIARIVARGDDGSIQTYYISRVTPPTATAAGCRLASSLAPIGRIAALPVGEELELTTPAGTRTLEVLERALLRPSRSAGEWDSRDTILEGTSYNTVTITSLRALLSEAIEVDTVDALDALLAEERARGNVIDGIRRAVIRKMGLRDQPILDQFQDAIFRLPLNMRLLLLGPPGTGKTTTLIRRLGQKISNYLDAREQQLVQAAGTAATHAQSWLMFTPTVLLQQYVKEAFAWEGVAASDQRIVTWADYRRDLARSRFGILRTATGSGSFVMKESIFIANDDALARQTEWFDDFFAWQAHEFWAAANAAAQALAANPDAATAQIGRRLLTLISARDHGAEAATYAAIFDLSGRIRAIVDTLKKDTDDTSRKALAAAFKANSKLIDEFGQFIATLADASDDTDEHDSEDDDEAHPATVGREAAVAAYMQAVRTRARADANNRSLARSGRAGRISEWLGDRLPTRDERVSIGRSLEVQDACRRFLNPLRRYIDGMPARYRRFRRFRQGEGRWYRSDAYPANDITPLEVDLILLAILRTGSQLLRERSVLNSLDRPPFAPLNPLRALHKNQIMVDEVADFSPIQLACMGALADPQIRSFFACGDFNQRITSYGLRSEAEVRWCFPDIDIRTVETTYRHSKQLNELAKALVRLSSGAENRAVLPERVDSDAVKPVLGTGLQTMDAKIAWLAARIAEIEKLTTSLPSVAILVNAETEVQPLAERLNRALERHNIRAVACPNGQVMGQDNDVRVFDVQHIKGLEFEAVFFIGVDDLATAIPELFDKYLYVGATRAATYLGLTCRGPRLQYNCS